MFKFDKYQSKILERHTSNDTLFVIMPSLLSYVEAVKRDTKIKLSTMAVTARNFTDETIETVGLLYLAMTDEFL